MHSRGCLRRAVLGLLAWCMWWRKDVVVLAFVAGGEVCGGRACVGWARRYMKACVCGVRQEASFALGLLSVACWGVAEVPQIVTNFREASTEGISLVFLITWVVGDVFNLAGCYLEPSTLPTQFYMALLYTITTFILVGQVVYYDHIVKLKPLGDPLVMRPEMKDRAPELAEDHHRSATCTDANNVLRRREQLYDIDTTSQSKRQTSAPVQLASTQGSSPIAFARSGSPLFEPDRDGLYYTSARSLASSRTPTAGSYMAVSRSCGGGTSSTTLSSTTLCSLLQHNSHPLDADIDHDDELHAAYSSPPSSANNNDSDNRPNGSTGTISITSSRSAPAACRSATVVTVAAPSDVFPSVPSDDSSGIRALRGISIFSFAMFGSVIFCSRDVMNKRLGSVARNEAEKSHSSRAGPREAFKLIGRSRKLLIHAFAIGGAVSGMDHISDENNSVGGGDLDSSSSSMGVCFGWLMAAIYMGGRLPQIYLNMKRGSVEGLNPLMFTFAVLGNATYVASILVNSTEWKQIKSNMPWLVDAGVCVLLDFFILSQFLYYYSRKPRYPRQDDVGYKWLE